MAGTAAIGTLIAHTLRDGVAEVRLERPERRNAVTTELLQQLDTTLTTSLVEGARAVVLTGAPPVFCAGADLDEFPSDAPHELRRERIELVGRLIVRLARFEVPTIAAVESAAVGAGWGLALACDVCFATAGTTFSLPEVAKGFRIPEALFDRLIAVVGPTRAAHLAYTGEACTAERGLDLGFVSRVVADRDELLGAAHELAASLAARPPASIDTVKRPLGAATSKRSRT